MKQNPNYNFLVQNWTKHRIFVLQGGTRSGKTYSALQTIITLCYKYKNAGLIVTVCRKTLPALKGSAYRDFLEIIKTEGLYSEDLHNKSELTYELNGNTVEFISIDQPQKIRGRKRDVLFVNEMNELTYEDWRQLLFRTTSKVIGDYNPSMSDSYIYDHVLTRNDVGFLITSYKDNIHLPKEIVTEIELLQSQDEEYWNVFGLGQRGSIYKGLIYKRWQTFAHEPNAGSVSYGLDFGFSSDPLALVRVRTIGNDIYVTELVYQTQLTNSDIIKIIKEQGIRFEPIYADSANPDRIAEMFRAGINVMPAHKGAGSVKAGIDNLMGKNLYINENSLNLLKEIKTYKYRTDKEGNELPEPVDSLNHALDALRYAVFTDAAEPKALPSFTSGNMKHPTARRKITRY